MIYFVGFSNHMNWLLIFFFTKVVQNVCRIFRKYLIKKLQEFKSLVLKIENEMCLSHSHSICDKSFNFHDRELKILWVMRKGVLRKQDFQARSHGIFEKKLQIK